MDTQTTTSESSLSSSATPDTTEDAESSIPPSERASTVATAMIDADPPKMAEQIRKNLERKRQKRPKIELPESKSDGKPTAETAGLEEGNRRRSLLEYTESDLAKSGMKTNIYRFLAIGHHNEKPVDFLALHEKIIEVINTASYDEPATGYLIVYPKHFMHLLEGSEMTINKYIAICAELFQGVTQSHIETNYHAKADKTYTARMVILHYLVVRERYTDEWYHVLHFTPTRRGLTHYRGFRKRLFEFIKNVWVMAGVLADSYNKEAVIYSEDPAEAAAELLEEKELYGQIQQKLHTYFPGTDIMNYFLKQKKRTPPLRTPAEYIEKFWTVPSVIMDSETTWPIPCRIAPYH